MAVSVSSVSGPIVPGAERRTVRTVTFDGSYLAGGEPLTPNQLGLDRVAFAICTIAAHNSAVNVVSAHYDTGARKIILRGVSTEVTNAADVSDVKVQVVAYGS